jgi:hypothetical protein
VVPVLKPFCRYSNKSLIVINNMFETLVYTFVPKYK